MTTAPVAFNGPVFARVQHLDLSGRISLKDAVALGHGGLSEVFKVSCRLHNGEEASVAVKRLRYHLKSLDMGKVRQSLFSIFDM